MTEPKGTTRADRVFNFSSGPAVLPVEVIEDIQSELLALPGVGSSILEISHRSQAFDRILDETVAELRSLLAIGESHAVLFLQGGASLQFSMLPMNLLRGSGRTADYVVTGTWGTTAAKEARKEGAVNIAWDGAATRHDRLPDRSEIRWSDDPAYVYVTSNETIQGVQWPADPPFGPAPLVCDASSDFLSRPLDISRYGVLYACAQKNAGIAGVTVVVIRRDLLDRCPDGLPTMLDYRTHASAGSRANTPPVFAIYVLGKVCRWVRTAMGGLDGMARHNAAKARLLYDVLDASGGFYAGHARRECRSTMNVTFRLPTEELEKAFVAGAARRGLVELKGHRSVGGIRASIYNAMPVAAVESLREHMLEFQAAAAALPAGRA
ncbi:MAG: 3-phosphoserine/phosphohydroxythreonine transaminase [Planctomycetaceae bacterium]